VPAQPAASNEALRCLRVFEFEFILQANNPRRDRNRLSASNTRHASLALSQFCVHLDLTIELYSTLSMDRSLQGATCDRRHLLY
jgi:hypothetical protein